MCCTPLLLSVPLVTSPYFGLACVVSCCCVWAVLPPFVPCCVSLRVVPGWLVFCCFLWLRGLAVLFCSVCSSFWCGFRCFCGACSPLLCFFSVLLASLAPRVVSCVCWSSLHSCVLVPPSEYLVAAVTAPLPCFHAGCMVSLCFPSVIRFMATKAFCPVWGFLLSTPCYW